MSYSPLSLKQPHGKPSGAINDPKTALTGKKTITYIEFLAPYVKDLDVVQVLAFGEGKSNALLSVSPYNVAVIILVS